MARDLMPSSRQPINDGNGTVTEPWSRFFKAMSDFMGAPANESITEVITESVTTEVANNVQSSSNAAMIVARKAQAESSGMQSRPPYIDTTRLNAREVAGGSSDVAPRDFVEATLSATLTFPKYASEGDVICVRNGDGSTITLLGNGKTINGETSGRLERKGTSIDFYYFANSDKWVAK